MEKKSPKDEKLTDLLNDLENIEKDSSKINKPQKQFKDLDVELQKVVKEFRKLKKYSEKLEFWKKEFWIHGSYSVDSFYAIQKFINILPENENERRLFNNERITIITQDFKESYLPKTITNKNITFEELKIQYLTILENEDNKSKFIKNEISRITNEVWEIENSRISNISYKRPVAIKNNLLIRTFQLASNQGIEPTLNEKVYNKKELIDIIAGLSAGRYMKFLQNELVKYKTLKPTPVSKRLWNGNIESLKLLHKILIDDELIDKIEENEFINHFTYKPYNCHINWLEEQIIFVRFFDKLKFAINPCYLLGKNHLPSPSELSKHFTIKGIQKTSKHLRQSRSSLSDINTKFEDEIDSIIDKIKKEFIRH